MIRTKSNDGFTIVEIAVVVPILMVIVLSLFSIMFNFLISSNREQARLSQTFGQASALDRIEADIRLSTAYLSQLDSTVTDPTYQMPTHTPWSFAGSGPDNRVLILRQLATTQNPLADVRSPVFTKSTPTGSCTADPSLINGKLTYNIVYFVANNTLYRRIVTDRTTPNCTDATTKLYQKQSCPSAKIMSDAGQTLSSDCAATDEVIAQNVSKFSATYYATQTDSVALDAYTSPTLLASALSVNYTIGNTQRAYGGAVDSSSSLRTVSSNIQFTGTP